MKDPASRRGEDIPYLIPEGGMGHLLPGGRLPMEGKDPQINPGLVLALTGEETLVILNEERT